MSSIFEEDSNASDDFSWRYDVANTDYGFLIFCLENDNLQNLIQTVMSDNKLLNKKFEERFASLASCAGTAKAFGSMIIRVSRCKKEIVSKLGNCVSNIPVNYRVDAKVSVDVVETFYAVKPVETKFKPLVVESSAYLNANKFSNIGCSIVESGDSLGARGEQLELSYAFLQKFYTILDPSTHLSTYARLLGRSKNEISEWLNSGRTVSKLILDPVIESAARSYQTSLFGKRVVPDNEMILVNVDGHQGGLIISKQFSKIFTL